VFTDDGTKGWVQEAELVPGNGERRDFFGDSVAIYRDTIIVGSNGDDDNGEGSGSAYVFVRDGSNGWHQQAKLVPGDWAADDRFGSSVAIYEDTVVVGAPEYTGTVIVGGSGSAYTFVKDGSNGWRQQAKLVPTGGAPDQRFGAKVAIHENTVIIGAHGDNANGVASGSAYVFVRSVQDNSWSQQAKLVPDDGEQYDSFGCDVDIYEDVAIVGAWNDREKGVTPLPGFPAATEANSGSAYIFARDTTSEWFQQTKLLPSDGVELGYFGYAVAIHGDAAIVGAMLDRDNGISIGSVYVFARESGSNWLQQTKLIDNDAGFREQFGEAVDIYGSNLIVGPLPHIFHTE